MHEGTNTACIIVPLYEYCRMERKLIKNELLHFKAAATVPAVAAARAVVMMAGVVRLKKLAHTKHVLVFVLKNPYHRE